MPRMDQRFSSEAILPVQDIKVLQFFIEKEEDCFQGNISVVFPSKRMATIKIHSGHIVGKHGCFYLITHYLINYLDCLLQLGFILVIMWTFLAFSIFFVVVILPNTNFLLVVNFYCCCFVFFQQQLQCKHHKSTLVFMFMKTIEDSQ